MKVKRLYKMKKIIEKIVFNPESLQVNNSKGFRMTKKVFTFNNCFFLYIFAYVEFFLLYLYIKR